MAFSVSVRSATTTGGQRHDYCDMATDTAHAHCNTAQNFSNGILDDRQQYSMVWWTFTVVGVLRNVVWKAMPTAPHGGGAAQPVDPAIDDAGNCSSLGTSHCRSNYAPALGSSEVSAAGIYLPSACGKDGMGKMCYRFCVGLGCDVSTQTDEGGVSPFVVPRQAAKSYHSPEKNCVSPNAFEYLGVAIPTQNEVDLNHQQDSRKNIKVPKHTTNNKPQHVDYFFADRSFDSFQPEDGQVTNSQVQAQVECEVTQKAYQRPPLLCSDAETDQVHSDGMLLAGTASDTLVYVSSQCVENGSHDPQLEPCLRICKSSDGRGSALHSGACRLSCNHTAIAAPDSASLGLLQRFFAGGRGVALPPVLQASLNFLNVMKCAIGQANGPEVALNFGDVKQRLYDHLLVLKLMMNGTLVASG